MDSDCIIQKLHNKLVYHKGSYSHQLVYYSHNNPHELLNNAKSHKMDSAKSLKIAWTKENKKKKNMLEKKLNPECSAQGPLHRGWHLTGRTAYVRQGCRGFLGRHSMAAAWLQWQVLFEDNETVVVIESFMQENCFS